LRAGELRVDRARRRAWRGERALALSARELEVLALLVERPGAIVTREELMGGVWDDGRIGSPATVDGHVLRLRRELGEPELIAAVRGVGYRLRT
jgi:DNA-binding response OmpR family regulator